MDYASLPSTWQSTAGAGSSLYYSNGQWEWAVDIEGASDIAASFVRRLRKSDNMSKWSNLRTYPFQRSRAVRARNILLSAIDDLR